MIRRCADCKRGYDDEFHSTLCPHDGINDYCRKHDLFACYLCQKPEEKAEA